MKNVNICCNHVLILFEYFKTISRDVLDSKQRNRLPDPPKRQVTPLARIFNLPVTRRVKYSSSKTETFPYLVFQGIDETGRITDTRWHTYDPITFRMQITPSNHELEQRYPAISPSSILFDPVHILIPPDTTFNIHLCLCARNCFFPLRRYPLLSE